MSYLHPSQHSACWPTVWSRVSCLTTFCALQCIFLLSWWCKPCLLHHYMLRTLTCYKKSKISRYSHFLYQRCLNCVYWKLILDVISDSYAYYAIFSALHIRKNLNNTTATSVTAVVYATNNVLGRSLKNLWMGGVCLGYLTYQVYQLFVRGWYAASQLINVNKHDRQGIWMRWSCIFMVTNGFWFSG